MFCQYQYYRWNTEELQTAVAHSDGKYQCEEMSDCPYTGTTIINKIPWTGEKDQEDSKSNTEGKHGLLDKIKKLFRERMN